MQCELKVLEKNLRQIDIDIETAELVEIEKKVIRDIQKTAVVPGFRKGKVPAGLIKKRYADVIQSEVLEKAVSEFYTKALEEVDIKPVAQGSITNIDFNGVDSGLKFTIEVEVEPEIELKKYKKLKLEKEVAEVTDQMVSDALEDMRRHFATTKEIDEAVEGSLLSVELQEMDENNTPIVGRKYEDVAIEIGSGKFDEDMEKQLIGATRDEERVLRGTSPSPDPEKPGEPVSYMATIKTIEEQEIPPLDDELAKGLQDDDIETLDQLKERVRTNLQANLDRRGKQQFTSRLIDELLKENPFDAPEAMVDNYLNHVLNDLKQRSKQEDIDEESVRKKYRPDAIHSIRWHLLKQKLIEVENLEVNEDDIKEKINSFGMGGDEAGKIFQDMNFLNRIREDIIEEKLLNLLEEHADVTEVQPQPVEA